MYSSDKYFFELIIHGNKKQSISALKYINSSQLKSLKIIASDILEGKIPLSPNQVKKLKGSAYFIRNLARKKVINNKTLIQHFSIVKILLEIKFDYVETCAKISSHSFGRMGKGQRPKYERNETSSSEYSSSGESEIFSEESEYCYESKGRRKSSENRSNVQEFECSETK